MTATGNIGVAGEQAEQEPLGVWRDRISSESRKHSASKPPRRLLQPRRGISISQIMKLLPESFQTSVLSLAV